MKKEKEPKKLSGAEVIEMFRKRTKGKSSAACARMLKISPQYMSDQFTERRPPGYAVLNYLGLRRERVTKVSDLYIVNTGTRLKRAKLKRKEVADVHGTSEATPDVTDGEQRIPESDNRAATDSILP